MPLVMPSTLSEHILASQVQELRLMNLLNASIFAYKPTEADYHWLGDPKSSDRVVIRPGFAEGLWYAIQRLVRIILSAAHAISMQDMPISFPRAIPHQLLDQVGLPSPPILGTSTIGNPLVFLQTKEQQERLIAAVQWVGMVGVQWVMVAIERS